MSKPDYDRAVQRHTSEMEAAQTELTRLRAPAPSSTARPSLDALLTTAGSWRSILDGADIPAKRDVLAILVERVVPERVGWGRYTARVT